VARWRGDFKIGFFAGGVMWVTGGGSRDMYFSDNETQQKDRKMSTKSVTFTIESDAVNYAATLEKAGELIDSIDKNSSGAEVKNLPAGSYEARIYFRGHIETYAEMTVTVAGSAPKSKKFTVTSPTNEARGGVPFRVT
jgi:hypothetical protein